MLKEVYLVTTEGCEGCKIMKNILMSVWSDYYYTFSITICRFKFVPEYIKKFVIIEDFPLLVFVEDEQIKYHIVGTMTKKKLQDILEELNFN